MNTFDMIIDWQQCSETQQTRLLRRPAISASETLRQSVADILQQVKQHGDAALRHYSERFDGVCVSTFSVSADDMRRAENRLSDDFKQALNIAYANIDCFHRAQLTKEVDIETQPGVRCQQLIRPIRAAGLYIPGGRAPLFSTVLMLGIPARIAGCERVVLCSPPPIADEILYAAMLCHITEIVPLGGAQAIAALAFGTASLARVDKIFGPGNAFVTEAKRQVSQLENGPAIDMPAGPSEVLVIADAGASAQFIAADLLSQAEHGPDSQVILLTPSHSLAQAVADELENQLAALPNNAVARQSLSASHLIVAQDLSQCVAIANRYAPEHLIIQTRKPRALLADITNAGSVFLGDWSPESVGDYASGTNHVLPTYGYSATCSSLGIADFQKRMTVQELTPQGLTALAPTVETLAAAEKLFAHKNAVTLRTAALRR